MAEGGDEVARLKIEAHEKLCAERYANIHGRIDLVFQAMVWAAALLIVTLIGVAGWGLQQINQGQKEQLALMQRAMLQVKADQKP